MINTAATPIDTYHYPEHASQGWSAVEKRLATMIRRIDDCVADLVQLLKDLGVDDETLIVFTSDNGPHHESYFNEIYDVDADPQETNNLALAPAFAGLQQRMKDRVLRLRRPDAAAPRPYDSVAIAAATGTAFTNGVLEFAVFEGTWPWVPEFAGLAPVSTGQVAGLDLSVRTREDHFGIAFSGHLAVPAEGDYTFYLHSDGGAHFRVHEAAVMDDDFQRTGDEVSGTIRLQAGRHPFRLYYRHATGPRMLQLDYSGPNVTRRPFPARQFSLPGIADTRPQAFDDQATTPRDTAVVVPVLANDSDDGLPQPLTVSAVGTPWAGTAVITNGTHVVYTPAAGFLGQDHFPYTITEGEHEASATAAVNVVFQDGDVWFPCNQTAGLETVEAGGGYRAALSGYASDAAPWVQRRWNRALQVDGSTQFAAIRHRGTKDCRVDRCGFAESLFPRGD